MKLGRVTVDIPTYYPGCQEQRLCVHKTIRIMKLTVPLCKLLLQSIQLNINEDYNLTPYCHLFWSDIRTMIYCIAGKFGEFTVMSVWQGKV